MLPFQHPFTCLVSGPTGCGKTYFTFDLIEQASQLIQPPPQKVYYSYGEFQPIFAKYPSIEFHDGLVDLDIFDGKQPSLLVVDDLMDEADEKVAKVFTKLSHHRNLSVIFLVQNLFSKNKHARVISLNSHYMILFKNPRDTGQFAILARQMYPTGWKHAVEAYCDATARPYGYLLVDLKPETDDKYRLRTNIFPNETTAVYVKRK